MNGDLSAIWNAIISFFDPKIVSTLIGTTFGFALSEVSMRRREKRAQQKQARSVRTILSIEIEDNLKALRDLWAKVNDITLSCPKEDEEYYNYMKRLALANRLTQSAMVAWSHKAWESQFPFLTIALTETEITELHLFHKRLDFITATGDKLADLNSEQSATLAQAKPASVSLPFSSNAPDLWDDCERVVLELLENGNPLH